MGRSDSTACRSRSPGRVRRADVHHQERRQRPEQPGAFGVVVDGRLGRGGLGLADVDADRHVGGAAAPAGRASSPAPWLLNPIRLSSARSSGSRNIRGCGLPGCACAVTVPTSAYPKPSAPHVRSPRPSLSKPAARPSGPAKRTPKTVLARTGSRGASHRASGRRVTAARGDGPQQCENPGVDAFGRNQEQRPPQRAVHHGSQCGLLRDARLAERGLLAAQQHPP